MANYRVIEIETNEFSSQEPKESVKWEGSDIMALSRKYPRSSVYGADPLCHHEIEGGKVRWNYRFEIEIGGFWHPCRDPRVRLSSGLSDLEKAIDEENRRDFPGDFIDDDEDYFDVPDDYEDSEDDWEGWDEPAGVWPKNDGFSSEDGYGYPE